jgi:hypothetical protein
MPLAALARWPKASIDGPSGSPPQSQAKDAQASTYAFAAAAVADAAGARVASTEAAEALADEFEKALTLLEVIGCRMASLSETWTMLEGGRQGPVPLSPRVVDLIRHQPKPATSSPEEKQRWSLFLRGLQENPDTPIPATVLPDRPKPPTPLPVFTKPGLPWPEHQRQLAEKHAARIANLEKDRQTEVQRGLQVHRDAAKKLRDAEGKKSIAS